MIDVGTDNDGINRLIKNYEYQLENKAIQAYYEGSNFYNVGFWEPGVMSQKAACLNLMDKLLERTNIKHGKVLDVACGWGATTNFLSQKFGKQNVIGINISNAQVIRCRENYSELNFQCVSATDIDFSRESFDLIISVEAALHFNTRGKFFSECMKVLKPGGQLIVSDIIIDRDIMEWISPVGNNERSISDYEDSLIQAGFVDINIQDSTSECWIPYIKMKKKWILENAFLDIIPPKHFEEFCHYQKSIETFPISHYILVSALKRDK